MENMKILKGQTIVSGIALGKICTIFNEEEKTIPHYSILDSQIDIEIIRFNKGMDKARNQLQEYVEESYKTLDGNASKIFYSHYMILKDKNISSSIINSIKNNLINVEHAIYDVFENFIDLYRKKDMHFHELIHDFQDVRETLLNEFMNSDDDEPCPIPGKSPIIIVTKRLSPYMINDMFDKNVLAFVSEEGGFTTHASVLARSMGIPMMFNVPVTSFCNCNDFAIVDAENEKFILNPDNSTIKDYEIKVEVFKQNQEKYKSISKLPAKTKDNLNVDLKVNINLPNEIYLLKEHNFDGIGLLRTEFIFLGKTQPPSEDEQFQTYKKIVSLYKDKPVTIRLLDIGSDKTPAYLELPHQVNPDLGIKGARSVNYFKEIFMNQIKALIRAAEYGNLRILYPMVTDISDIKIFSGLIEEAKNELSLRNIKINQEIPIGAMIETPSAAIMIDQIIENVDFVNIGSNDLFQYTLAVSREHQDIYSSYPIFHPAVLRLIKMVVEKVTEKNKEVCLCGEIANIEEAYPLFLDMDLTSFSVSVSKHSVVKLKLSEIDKTKIQIVFDDFINKIRNENKN